MGVVGLTVPKITIVPDLSKVTYHAAAINYCGVREAFAEDTIKVAKEKIQTSLADFLVQDQSVENPRSLSRIY